jgi:hypothetical protein
MKPLARFLAVVVSLMLASPAAAQDALDSPFLFYGYANGDLDGADRRYNGGRVHMRQELNPGALLNLDLTHAVRGFDLFAVRENDFTNASATYQQVFEAAPTYSVSGLLGVAYGRGFRGFARGDELAITMGALGEVQLGATGALHGQIQYHGAAGFDLGIGGGVTQYFMSGGAIRIDYMMYEGVKQASIMFGYAL